MNLGNLVLSCTVSLMLRNKNKLFFISKYLVLRYSKKMKPNQAHYVICNESQKVFIQKQKAASSYNAPFLNM